MYVFVFFFFNDTATTEIYTLSLHDALPILSGTSLGCSIFAAASATLPKVVVRPDGLCLITLFDALHSDAGTFHSLAAAAINIVRAVAPALRTYSFDSRIARLPAVN